MALSKPESADIVKTVKETFTSADAFLPVEDPVEQIIIGWTFRVSGPFWTYKFGWATTEGFVFTDLCGNRVRAEEIMRKVVKDERERSKRA